MSYDEYEEEVNLNNDELEELEIDGEELEAIEKENSDPEKNPEDSHYVDKKILYEAYVAWYKQCDEAREAGLERPEPPRYISESILKVCKKLASRYNFANYPFRDEMVGDAIENLYRYVDRFNIEKSQNPFGYFSMIAFRAMVRRITDEKKKASVKYHMLMNSGVLDTLETQGHDDSEAYQSMIEYYRMQANDSLANVIHVNKKRKPTERKKPPVDDVEAFMNGDDTNE